MPLISPSHQWGQLFSTQSRWVGEACCYAWWTRTENRKRSSVLKDIIFWKSSQSVHAVFHICQGQCACCYRQLTLALTDCVSVRWCWNKKGACLWPTPPFNLLLYRFSGNVVHASQHSAKRNHGNCCLKMTEAIWKPVFSMISGNWVVLYCTEAASETGKYLHTDNDQI